MKTDQFQNGVDADAVLYTMLISAALTGEHREFEFIRCWEHRKIAKYFLKGLKVVIKNLKTMAKVADKLIKAGQGNLIDHIYAKQLHLSIDYYKKECAIVRDMLSEYREYVCSGHLIDTFVLPRLRTEDELVDYRTLPGVWMFKKPN